jgi:hypothetical protein
METIFKAPKKPETRRAKARRLMREQQVGKVACCHKRHGKDEGPRWFATTTVERNAHRAEAH